MPALKARYLEALVAEIGRGVDDGPLAADTIFFGGGTPSLLEPEEIARVIAACERAFDLAADREVTLEANPESVTEARLRGYRAAGVTRVSFGVQSFRDEELRRLSRLHDAARARAAVGEARAAGFDNVSLDLMMWLPGPERRGLARVGRPGASPSAPTTCRSTCSRSTRTRRCGTRWRGRAGRRPPTRTPRRCTWRRMERLDAAGYLQYEISNVARPGRRSRHNLKYWTDGDWLGFGCGAHSTRDGVRWKNVAATDDYIDRVGSGGSPAMDVRRLSADERLGDVLFTGLRLTDGVDLDELGGRFGVDVWRRFGAGARAVPGRRAAGTDRIAPPADPSGDAFGKRSNDGFRVGLSTLQ